MSSASNIASFVELTSKVHSFPPGIMGALSWLPSVQHMIGHQQQTRQLHHSSAGLEGLEGQPCSTWRVVMPAS